MFCYAMLFISYYGNCWFTRTTHAVKTSTKEKRQRLKNAYRRSARYTGIATLLVLGLLWYSGTASQDDPMSDVTEELVMFPSIYTSDIRIPELTREEADQVHLHMAFDRQSKGYKVGMDSFAEASVIRAGAVNPEWIQWKEDAVKERLTGLGGTVIGDHSVRMELAQRMNLGIDHLTALVVDDLPGGIDIIIGKHHQRLLGLVHSQHMANRYHLKNENHDVTIQAEPAEVLTSRMERPPLKVLATSAGCNFFYETMINQGFRIKELHSIEIDPDCRATADSFIPKSVIKHIAPHDVNKVPGWVKKTHYDLHINTSNCQPFSRLQDEPLGFKDSRAKAMVSAAALHRELKKVNPNILVFVENVIPHHKLVDVDREWEKMWEVPFFPIDAQHLGSACARPRMIGTNFAGPENLRRIMPVPQWWHIDDDALPTKPVMPCVVASQKTKNPPTLTTSKGSTRRLTPDENDKFMGYTAGISKGKGNSDDKRRQFMGNALNAYMTAEFFAHIPKDLSKRPSIVWSASANKIPSIAGMTAQQLSDHLCSMSREEKKEWIIKRIGNWTLPMLQLRLREGTGPNMKFKRGYPVPAKLRESMKHLMAIQIANGFLTEVELTEDMFVTPAFLKVKEGRFYPGTDAPMVRLLGDYRNINDCLEPHPPHWNMLCPEQPKLGLDIPTTAKWYKCYDIGDAFHTVRVHPDSKHLLVIELGGKYYQYNGSPQGLSHSPGFFNAQLASAMYRVFGDAHTQWWTGYVDDYGVFGSTKEEAEQRGELFEVFMEVIEKPLTDKIPNGEAKQDLELAGLYITPEGIRINDEAIEALKKTLTKFEVKSKSDARHVIGVIAYSHSAFEWDATNQTEYSRLTGILQDAIKGDDRMKWTEECKAACHELYEHITNRPYRYLKPETMIDDDHCLVIVTDASDDAIGMTLVRVNKPCASQVTEEDLKELVPDSISGL